MFVVGEVLVVPKRDDVPGCVLICCVRPKGVAAGVS